jgi:hypothetical protein
MPEFSLERWSPLLVVAISGLLGIVAALLRRRVVVTHRHEAIAQAPAPRKQRPRGSGGCVALLLLLLAGGGLALTLGGEGVRGPLREAWKTLQSLPQTLGLISEPADKTVAKAVQAMGGREAIDRVHELHMRIREGHVFDELGHPVTKVRGDLFYLSPDKFRLSLLFPPEFARSRHLPAEVTLIVNRDRALIGSDGRPLPPHLHPPFLRAPDRPWWSMFRLARLTPLLDSSGYSITSAGTSSVGGRSATGVQVSQLSQPGQPDIFLYFDKENRLLVKTGMQAAGPPDGRPTRYEVCYSDHRRVGELMQPGHIIYLMNGQKQLEFTDVEYVSPPQVTDWLFDIP